VVKPAKLGSFSGRRSLREHRQGDEIRLHRSRLESTSAVSLLCARGNAARFPAEVRTPERSCSVLPSHRYNAPMIAGKYQLLDFGNGRKLESLGGYRIDRPCPAAYGKRPAGEAWPEVDARFDAMSKSWHCETPWPQDYRLDCGAFAMPVQPTPFGHIGLFPEQRSNWRWLDEGVRSTVANDANDAHVANDAHDAHDDQATPRPFLGLNLFGYTGASSIAIARAGGSAVHVDAAKPNVLAARHAAVAEQVDQSIRFLTDDARKFVARELRRKRRYDMIVLDPPAYGHGPSGKAWRLERDLWDLLDDCLRLLSGPKAALLVTGHSEQIGHREIADWLREQVAGELDLQSDRSWLVDATDRRLDCGFYVRARW